MATKKTKSVLMYKEYKCSKCGVLRKARTWSTCYRKGICPDCILNGDE